MERGEFRTLKNGLTSLKSNRSFPYFSERNYGDRLFKATWMLTRKTESLLRMYFGEKSKWILKACFSKIQSGKEIWNRENHIWCPMKEIWGIFSMALFSQMKNSLNCIPCFKAHGLVMMFPIRVKLVQIQTQLQLYFVTSNYLKLQGFKSW